MLLSRSLSFDIWCIKPTISLSVSPPEQHHFNFWPHVKTTILNFGILWVFEFCVYVFMRFAEKFPLHPFARLIYNEKFSDVAIRCNAVDLQKKKFINAHERAWRGTLRGVSKFIYFRTLLCGMTNGLLVTLSRLLLDH